MSGGAPASVRTVVSSSVRQNVAKAVRCHFVWSTMAMTSLRAGDHQRLICGLFGGRVAEA